MHNNTTHFRYTLALIYHLLRPQMKTLNTTPKETSALGRLEAGHGH